MALLLIWQNFRQLTKCIYLP